MQGMQGHLHWALLEIFLAVNDKQNAILRALWDTLQDAGRLGRTQDAGLPKRHCRSGMKA